MEDLPTSESDRERSDGGVLARTLALAGVAVVRFGHGSGGTRCAGPLEQWLGPVPDAGWTPETLLSRVADADRRRVATSLEAALHEGEEGEVVFRPSLDENTHVRLRLVTEEDGVVALLQDVSRELDARERARLAGSVDSLTGLPNRRQFQAGLHEAVARAHRSGRCLAVLHVEIDGFADVVDAFGSGPGDLVLREVAERVRTALRASDSLGRGSRVLARVGGAGFLVALSDLGGRFEPSIAAERLLGELRRPYPVGEAEIAVSASVGLATMPEAGHDAIDLLRHAEVALAHARHLGGDRLEVFREGLDRDAETRLQRASELFRGVHAGQLELVYQPVFNPAERTCQGVEALVRWRHPERGLLAPEEFLDVAEDTGIIVPLGEWVLAEACAQWRDWVDRGFGPVEIAVNLSGRQLRDPKLVARVHRVLDASGMDPVFLRLEVPEDVLTPAGDAARRALARLRRLGVGLTLDDFGTRSSSLARLRELDVDLLKIGRAFVAPVPSDQEHASLVAGIVALAHKLRFRVVAEGVETEEQLRYLRALDCEGVQGFLLGAPAPAADLERLLAGAAGDRHAKIIPFRRRAAS